MIDAARVARTLDRLGLDGRGLGPLDRRYLDLLNSREHPIGVDVAGPLHRFIENRLDLGDDGRIVRIEYHLHQALAVAGLQGLDLFSASCQTDRIDRESNLSPALLSLPCSPPCSPCSS